MRSVRFGGTGLCAVVSVVLAVVGCQEERPPISRVQANALDKAVFQGDWYYRQTVIDTPYSAGYTFVGEQGELEKIRWEIQEHYLIARRSYEAIAGAEPEGIDGASSEDGAAIAMWAIESHFDIRREYNPTTGEELNIVGENTTDRPWSQRQYMRVDWSQNLVTEVDFLLAARLFDGIRAEPVAYYVQDPADPDAPQFVTDEATGEVGYVDLVNKLFVEPQSVVLDGMDIPVCLLLYRNHLDCAPGEISVRHSFLKVDAGGDYQPEVYTGDRMERFGYFVTERPGYDPHYGVVEPARHRFVNRHDLWQASHRRDASGALVACTTDEECDDGAGSVCDLDLARARRVREGACTIPYRERAVKPVAYYLSENYPEDLEPEAAHVASEWNRAFVDTVASLRENECAAHDGENCAAERTRADAQQMFVLCHSPVVDDDAEACGARGTVARIGDLRFSLFGWVNEPHLSSPLGYGPSAADPETGEIIAGNAFLYGAGVETLATFARDLVSLLNGDLSMADVISGANVEAWVEQTTAPGSEVTGRPADDHAVPIDGDDVGRVAAAMDFSWVRALRGGRIQAPPTSAAELVGAREASIDFLARAGAFGRGDSLGRARLEALKGTPIEMLLTGPEMRIAAGIDPSLPVDEAVLEQASPLRGLSLPELRAVERARRRIAAEACVLVEADFADEGLLGLAREVARAVQGDGVMSWYGVRHRIATDHVVDPEAVRDMLRHPILHGLMAHEVGHTLGLRHNFSGSFDSLNYRPEYWALRDDGNMAPRAWDPMTEEEIDGRIREHQYSTVMDYGNNFVVTDANGIGHYDAAAIKMGYGDLVEVFTAAPDAGEAAWVVFMQSAGWPVPLKLSSFTGGGRLAAYAYTDLPAVFGGGVAGLEQRADVPFSSLGADSFLTSVGIEDRVVDAAGRPIVPYLFCSDEQADLGPDCMRYDAGADPYESLQSVIDAYWNQYVFHSFRRERLGFGVDGVSDRVLHRYFEKLQSANQIYALQRGFMEDVFAGVAGLEGFWEQQDGMGAWTLGVGASYALLTRVVAAPEPGQYAEGRRGDGSRALLAGGGGPLGGGVEIDAIDGRFLESTWNFDDGYFWFDQLERAGYYYDKALAIQVLTDPETHFIGRDTAADARQFQISFYSSFNTSLTALMRGILSDDWRTFAPRADVDGGLVYPDPLALVAGDVDGVPLDPNASFSIQLHAAAMGMALIPDTYDQTFFSQARLFVRGGAEGVEIDPSVATIEWVDPLTGLAYVAASFEDEDGVEQGVAARMLRHAQDLEDRGADAELRSFVDNLDLVRQLSWRLAF